LTKNLQKKSKKATLDAQEWPFFMVFGSLLYNIQQLNLENQSRERLDVIASTARAVTQFLWDVEHPL
jgi:hypothetical protein